LADLTVIVHLAFVVFVVVGGLLVLRRRGWVWIHLPAAIWGASIEWAGWVCPLTPLENWLRLRAGEHYLLPVLYPSELARGTQIVLGGLVVVINVAFYSVVWKRYRRLERS
jgi:hypothetical protein